MSGSSSETLAPAAPGRNAAHAPPGTGRSCGFHRYFLRICARLAGTLGRHRAHCRRHAPGSGVHSGMCGLRANALAIARRRAPSDTSWWLREYVHNARIVEGDHTFYKPRGGAFSSYAGPGWRYVDLAAGDALERGLSARTACDRAYSGAYVLETATSALIILALHGDDPRKRSSGQSTTPATTTPSVRSSVPPSALCTDRPHYRGGGRTSLLGRTE